MYFSRDRLFPKVGLSGKAKDSVDWNTHPRGVEFLPRSACLLLIHVALWAFTIFPSESFPVKIHSQAHLIHSPSASLFPFSSAPRDVNVAFCTTGFISIFSIWESVLDADPLPLLSWSRCHHTCLRQLGSTFFYSVSFHSATSASKANGDSELSRLSCPSLPWEIISSGIYSLQWKSRKVSCSLWSQVHSVSLIFDEASHFGPRGERGV